MTNARYVTGDSQNQVSRSALRVIATAENGCALECYQKVVASSKRFGAQI